MSQIEPQKRARKISMTDQERDAHLAELRVCRIGTIGVDGGPHVSALWYCWDGAALWLYSLIRSQRWVNLQRDRRVSVVIDHGVDYFEPRLVWWQWIQSGGGAQRPRPPRATLAAGGPAASTGTARRARL